MFAYDVVIEVSLRVLAEHDDDANAQAERVASRIEGLVPEDVTTYVESVEVAA